MDVELTRNYALVRFAQKDEAQRYQSLDRYCTNSLLSPQGPELGQADRSRRRAAASLGKGEGTLLRVGGGTLHAALRCLSH
jgi:hypothetical protein